MFARIGVSRMRCAISIGLLLTMIAAAGETLAQDAPSADPTGSSRERELRDQLNNILKELEDIQQQKESAKPEAERPSIIKEKEEAVSSEVTAEAVPAAGPDFDLADMSIVSKRLQKRPEGISLSATVPAETDSQPTRTMKESLESLPGVGPTLAKRIVEFREKKGKFKRVEELLAIPGISEKKWKALRDYLTVE